MSSLFCRHNRFTADCPICSKGTVLDTSRSAGTRPRPKPGGRSGARRSGQAVPPAQFSGPHVKTGQYERDDGRLYEVRLERVPGGVRLAEWAGGSLQRHAPELPSADLGALVAMAVEQELLPARDADSLAAAIRTEPGGDTATSEDAAASPGRAGDMREELRIEPRAAGRLRVARWLLYPSRGWELQDAPPMLPAARYAEALRAAARLGLLGVAAA